MSQLPLFVIFTDLKGFSKLKESQLIEFHEQINVPIASHLEHFQSRAKVWNTWGDAIFCAFENGIDAVEFTLAYRDYFVGKKLGNFQLKPRIAAHFGQLHFVIDPLNGNRPNLFGTNINSTARMEPVTRPGEIFVTPAFKQNYEQIPLDKPQVNFDPIGEITLAKEFGKSEVFRLRRAGEKKQVLDKLMEESLIKYMPSIPKISANEEDLLQQIQAITNKDWFIEDLNNENKIKPDATMGFLFKLAEHSKKLGAYEQCLVLLDKVEQGHLEVDGVAVHPYKYLPQFKKLKANALSKLGHYQEAADLIYGLWHSGQKDTETLCLLAAQYKRRAIFGQLKHCKLSDIEPQRVNFALLERASKLYLEAFRLDISDFYPAINAAYLFLMFQNQNRGRGTQLALYILDVWQEKMGESWWLDASLAEAQLLLEDYEESTKGFQAAILKHNPCAFDKTSTAEQIKIYAALNNKQSLVEGIVQLLEQ